MSLAILQTEIAPLRQALLNHPLYLQLQSLEDLQVFTQHHLFAVWDFMSLVKALQNQLTCTSLPWQPVGEPLLRRFINEIVWGEESDVDQHGQAISHYELYHRAMRELGASTAMMDTWLAQLKPQAPVYSQILASDLPLSIRQFVANTFGLIEEGKLHKIAAAFTFGREDLIPDMFLQLVKQLEDQNPDQLATFSYYLHRHIEVDGGEHGPIALRLVEKLCGADSLKWAEASQAAKASLQARIGLWDGVLAALPQVLVSDEHRLS